MDHQRQNAGSRRKRRSNSSKDRAGGRPAAEALELIAARRPNSPILETGKGRRLVAASAAPKHPARPQPPEPQKAEPQKAAPTRREARIVRVSSADVDDREKLRERLLERLVLSDGRGAISRAAEAYRQAGFSFPENQEVQLQLLEHFDESCAREAIDTLSRVLSREAPIKRPVLDQRLRRLEEYADDLGTREAAAALRRSLR